MEYTPEEVKVMKAMFQEAKEFVPSPLQLSTFNTFWTSFKDGAMIDIKASNIRGIKKGKHFILTRIYDNHFDTFCHIMRVHKILDTLGLEFGALPMIETPSGPRLAEEVMMRKPTGA
jgi:hypothetical protein